MSTGIRPEMNYATTMAKLLRHEEALVNEMKAKQTEANKRGFVQVEMIYLGINAIAGQTIVRLAPKSFLGQHSSLHMGDAITLYAFRGKSTGRGSGNITSSFLISGTILFISQDQHRIEIVAENQLSDIDEESRDSKLLLKGSFDTTADWQAILAIREARASYSPLVKMVLEGHKQWYDHQNVPHQSNISISDGSSISEDSFNRSDSPWSYLGSPGPSGGMMNSQDIPKGGQIILSRLEVELSDYQRDGVSAALGNPLTLIHGPAGTGKTTVLVEIIRQCLERNERVMITAASDVAVDNLVEALSGRIGNKLMVRWGKAMGTSQAKRTKHHIDYIVHEYHYTTKMAAKCSQQPEDEIEKLENILRDHSLQKGNFQEYLRILTIYRRLRKSTENTVLQEASIIATTLSESSSANFPDPQLSFDTLIIDEMSHARLADCLIPITSVKGIRRLVGAGGTSQLPPKIMTRDIKMRVLMNHTLFDWISDLHIEPIMVFLPVVYRMRPGIMQVARNFAYTLQSVNDGSTGQHIHQENIKMYDASHRRIIIDYHVSTMMNQQVVNCVTKLKEIGFLASDIGIITLGSVRPDYNLRLNVDFNVEMSTLHEFQGREKEAIIILLPYSATINSDDNVSNASAREHCIIFAITRAKTYLCVVTESAELYDTERMLQYINC